MRDYIEVNKEEVMTYLDNLRESGVTNMYGAGPYLQMQFGVPRAQGVELLVEWMNTYSERKKEREEK